MTTTPTVADQAGVLLGNAAGYVGVRTIEIGLRFGLYERIRAHAKGVDAGTLAAEAGVDAFYAGTWARAAVGAGTLEVEGDRYRLAPHVETLLFDTESPAYVGGLFKVLGAHEVFDLFAENLRSGKRIWWNETSPEWILGVSETGGAFNNRLIPTALAKVPGIDEVLAGKARILELACGVGLGLIKYASAYPKATITGLDGDQFSLDLARKNLAEAGLTGSIDLIHSTLEDLDREGEFDLVTINVSMHEARDLDAVARNVKRALKPGGLFVISDFPFPTDQAGLRTVPGRVMSGIQFFEAQIDDQLLPTAAFVALLEKHGFTGVGSFDVTPTHAITYGRA